MEPPSLRLLIHARRALCCREEEARREARYARDAAEDWAGYVHWLLMEARSGCREEQGRALFTLDRVKWLLKR